MAFNSRRRVLSGDNGRARVVVGDAISSTPSLFQDFFNPVHNATFVDKTLAIEAFLRDGLDHHLVLRPRRSGKSYTLSMIRSNRLYFQTLQQLTAVASGAFLSVLNGSHSLRRTLRKAILMGR
jgi:hypothetical protein